MTTAELAELGKRLECGLDESSHHWIGDTCSHCGVAWNVWAHNTIKTLGANFVAAAEECERLRAECSDWKQVARIALKVLSRKERGDGPELYQFTGIWVANSEAVTFDCARAALEGTR